MSDNSLPLGPPSDAPAEAPVAHNLPEYTVSEIGAALKRTLEEGFGRVRIRGEVSGFKRAASGHLDRKSVV